jgi:hypothetical protein
MVATNPVWIIAMIAAFSAITGLLFSKWTIGLCVVLYLIYRLRPRNDVNETLEVYREFKKGQKRNQI